MTMPTQAHIRFIGTVHSVLQDPEACPLQEREGAPGAMIEIYPDFIEGLALQPGQEILLFTWLHLADRRVLRCRTRRNKSGPMTGVFSTRSPDRPNPIGLHAVRVSDLPKPGFFRVDALEVLDGTPVIDIKPLR